MADLVVRRAEKPDLPAVLALYAELNRGRAVPLAEAEAILDRFAAYPDYALYVAERDGGVVGTFCLAVLDNIAHWGTPSGIVESVVVAGPQRGTGIGRLMMREAFRIAAGRGCYKVALSSNVEAEASHRFYESLGFARYGYSFRLDPSFVRENAA